MKGLWVHGALLAVATVLGLAVWARDDEEGAPATAAEVEVWGGSPDSITSIRFESPERTVVVEPKKDDYGRYYITRVDKLDAPHPVHDAGAPAPASGKRSTERFIGVKAAAEFVEQIAPLSALRKIGPLDPKRASDFGLDKPEGTLKVKIAGTEHALVIGGSTPGGQERYAKHVASGIVYAVPGDLANSLLSAESRLLERNLHGFQDEDVTRVRVSKRGKSRELVAVREKKGGWADGASPQKLDETAGNWMTKLGRLNVVEYIEQPRSPIRPEDAVVRVEYFGGAKSLGFIELYKAAGGEKGSEYMARTEYGRWPVKVLSSAAEQVDQDSASVLK